MIFVNSLISQFQSGSDNNTNYRFVNGMNREPLGGFNKIMHLHSYKLEVAIEQ